MRQEIDARTARVGTICAEGGHPDPDDVRLVCLDLIVVQPEFGERRFADIGDQDVGCTHETLEHFLGVLSLKIQDQAALASVQAQVGPALFTALGAQVAAVVALV